MDWGPEQRFLVAPLAGRSVSSLVGLFGDLSEPRAAAVSRAEAVAECLLGAALQNAAPEASVAHAEPSVLHDLVAVFFSTPFASAYNRISRRSDHGPTMERLPTGVWAHAPWAMQAPPLCARLTQPSTPHFLPPPWIQQLPPACALLVQPENWQRLPPPWATQKPRLTTLVEQPSTAHFLPPPCEMQKPPCLDALGHSGTPQRRAYVFAGRWSAADNNEGSEFNASVPSPELWFVPVAVAGDSEAGGGDSILCRWPAKHRGFLVCFACGGLNESKYYALR